ncbi:adenylate/guanylate cyclase domain-containing protein [Noviherbaspirillum sp. CPCC 100848]|uniref:Adenylate/guanylate cyclase domain-containing protein n=1 Tax=Noviherbaspirillum album TaxID=3080276 RepID=A0ABU6J802_9BURK|nr:adenylate/guanylate cyclase domain-containing protein [Noviherbaspirillum sp. CPCC 100848]MEC4719324.1 adenylate/guanylate cyclase domain-containing protein [Noviherbaspirillum sp. CPCC 100848]
MHRILSRLSRVSFAGRRAPQTSAARVSIALSAVFLLALAFELFSLRLLATVEARLGDAYMRRHAAAFTADPSILIVDIDDASMQVMQEYAGLWAWPREIHADLIDALSEFAPRAIIFDIAFAEQDLQRPKSDARLSSSVARNPHVYLSAVRLSAEQDAKGTPVSEFLPSFIPDSSAVAGAKHQASSRAAIQLPLAIDRAAWRLGLINSAEDADGVLRRYQLYSEVAGNRLPSLPGRVAASLAAAVPAGGDFLLRWPRQGHQRLPYGELYRLLTERRPLLGPDEMHALDRLFRDKVIVVGSSAAGSFDHHLTPLGSGHPGVDVLAVALDNLLTGRSVRTAGPVAPFLFGAVLLVALAAAFMRGAHPLGTGLALLAATGAALGTADHFLGRNVLLPLATPLLFAWAWFACSAIAGYLRERRGRQQTVALFRRFLNPDVVRQIVEQGETVESLSGRTREITVLFSDIRGFTTLSENRSPQEVVSLLNRYFERQVDVVFRHGGTLDKFIGDCIMAFWGAPVEDGRHAARAVAAALEMEQVLLEFRQMLLDEGSAVGDFDVGIGVHTGPAVVGFIGARKKLEYTAIGDTVNLASRVEGMTKGVARILVTKETMQAAAAGAASTAGAACGFEARGAFEVKGRAAGVELYEPRRTT